MIRLSDRLVTRILKLSPIDRGYDVHRGIRVPMRDGVALIADHYATRSAKPKGTLLVRTPYGRGFPHITLLARPFAARGYHVLYQSTRGTYGSEGAFVPPQGETEDSVDTMVWLRKQPWFDGRLGTLGASYLGFTQWAMLADPPPELKASVITVGPHDLAKGTLPDGVFSPPTALVWSEQMSVQPTFRQGLLPMLTANRRVAAAVKELPLQRPAETFLKGKAPWYPGWVSHSDHDDPYWTEFRLDAVLDKVTTPTLIQSGWFDVFTDQSHEQYAALAARGVDVALTIGPWTHAGIGLNGGRISIPDMLDWLDAHMTDAPLQRPAPVHVRYSGQDSWHAEAVWPPASTTRRWQLQVGGVLAEGAVLAEGGGSATGGTSTFHYDPTDPTPSVGGPTNAFDAGSKDNTKIEQRADVLTFTTEPLTAPLKVVGTTKVSLWHSADNEYCDVFVKLCEVDERGRSWNINERMKRLNDTDATTAGQVELELPPMGHVFAAGSRIRLQVAGGAYPRLARNLGVSDPEGKATEMQPSTHVIGHAKLTPSYIELPVVSG